MTRGARSYAVEDNIPISVFLLISVLCNSSMIAYLPVHLVHDLQMPAWGVSLYSVSAIIASAVVVSFFGKLTDRGISVVALCVISSTALFTSSILLASWDSMITVFFCGVLLLSISSTAIPSAYSLGRMLVSSLDVNHVWYNARLRTMNSLGWICGPLVAFSISGAYGPRRLFLILSGISLIGALFAALRLPDIRQRKSAMGAGSRLNDYKNKKLIWAASVCTMFSLFHALCSTALPIFLITEARLPISYPGIAFSFKCFVEIVSILLTPLFCKRLASKGILTISALLAVFAFAVLSHVQNIELLVIGSILEGAYYGLFAAVSMSIFQDALSEKLGLGNALYINSLYAGSVIGNVMVGFIAETFNFRFCIIVASFFAIITLVIVLLDEGVASRAKG